MSVGVRGGWRDATQVGYLRSRIRHDPRRSRQFPRPGDATASASLLKSGRSGGLALEGEVGYEAFTNEGGSGRAPSIETLYNPATAPGLFVDTNYIHSQGTAAIDWRTSPGYSRTGGTTA